MFWKLGAQVIKLQRWERASQSAEPFGGNRAVTPILSIGPWIPKSHIDISPSRTSAHNSMRHRQFFDDIEVICRPNTGLQLRPSMKHFRHWVQKLLSCKVGSPDRPAGPFGGNRAGLSILSLDPDPSKNVLLKKHKGARWYFFKKIFFGG